MSSFITSSIYPSNISDIFQRRKKRFSQALRQILSQISNDELIQKLILNETSSYFVSNRIEEIAASIFTDEQEKYIQSLIMIIQNLENNKRNVSRIDSKIINELIENKSSETLSQLLSQTSQSVNQFDASEPESYHIHENVDISDYSLKLKLIQTDVKTVKETFSMLCQKNQAAIDHTKKQSFEVANRLLNRVKAMELENQHLNDTIRNLNDSFEKSIIPKFMQKIKDIKLKYREIIKQNNTAIDGMTKEISERKVNQQILLDRNTQLTEKNEELKSVIQEQKDEINQYETKTLADQNDISNKSKMIDNLQKDLTEKNAEYDSLLAEHNELKKEYERLHAEFVLNEENNKFNLMQLNKLKEELPKEKEANLLAITELTKLKVENQQMQKDIDAKTIIIATYAKQNNELSSKLSNIDHSFSRFKETTEINENIAKINQDKVDEQDKQLFEFKTLLNEANHKNEQNEITIRKQKETIDALTDKVNKYEKQIDLQTKELQKNNDTIVGLEVALYQLKLRLQVIKDEKEKENIQQHDSLSSSKIDSEINMNLELPDENTYDKELIEINTNLRLQNKKMKKRIAKLEDAIRSIKEGNIPRKMEKLQNINQEQGFIIQTIRELSPDLDLTAFPQTMAKLVKAKEFADMVLFTLSIHDYDYDTAVLLLNDMKTDSLTMKRIRCCFTSKTDQEIIDILKSKATLRIFSLHDSSKCTE